MAFLSTLYVQFVSDGAADTSIEFFWFYEKLNAFAQPNTMPVASCHSHFLDIFFD